MWDILSTVGVFSTVGDIMINMGDIMINMGDIMSTVEVFSMVGDIIFCNLSTMGDIMIHVGGYYGYHEGCSVLWGYANSKRLYSQRFLTPP